MLPRCFLFTPSLKVSELCPPPPPGHEPLPQQLLWWLHLRLLITADSSDTKRSRKTSGETINLSFWICPSEKANQGVLCLWLGNKHGDAGAERCPACSSPAVMTGSAQQPCHCGWLSVLSFQFTVLALSWIISGLLKGFVAAGRFGLKRKALPPSEKMV